MRENVLKSFVRDTYKNTSSIPYIITGQVLMFVLIHVFELLSFDEIIAVDLFQWTYQHLSLSNSIKVFIQQPWSLFTHPFIYKGIFNLLFDCLWLYWIGNIFLNFLNNRQLLTVFLGGLFIGGLLYIAIGSFPYFSNPTRYWNTTTFGLAALMSSVMTLVPNLEIRMFFFGNIRLKTIAIIYIGLQFIFLIIEIPAAGVAYLPIACLGGCFIWQLQNGNDWSGLFKKNRRAKHLRVVEGKSIHDLINTKRKHPTDLPNQDLVDQILDKISASGYESLNSHEKEVLFKASKQDE
ncbi:rhomboid family intramembrane serine protease [Sphingobacterium faecale]|uniref:Rhomboid family intramembrane serine protease n=1 Tax=Sphingobacterium faecale TaxID=2803775 RepID=A0ABS1R7H1_9SPHI|nr:rhomboid family intramembrane serine protease [Sphingobacterium faecale]MBL1410623.1 rhomboid family intramembrane serine protease [Sphingobacterium faecale]